MGCGWSFVVFQGGKNTAEKVFVYNVIETKCLNAHKATAVNL